MAEPIDRTLRGRRVRLNNSDEVPSNKMREDLTQREAAPVEPKASNSDRPKASNTIEPKASNLDDAELVRRCRGGDEAAFELLVHRHQAKIYRLAYALTHDPEEAKDLTQEAFIRAYQGLSGFRGTARFGTWLHRIVVNVSIDHHRRRSTLVQVSYDESPAGEDPPGVTVADPAPGPDAPLDRKALAEGLRDAIRTLPPEQRATVVLREVEGLSYREIAGVMGCSIGTVMSRLHYGRRRLRERLRPFLEGESRAEGEQ